MWKFYHTFIVCALMTFKINAQAPNLVPNPGFELYDSCTTVWMGSSFNPLLNWIPSNTFGPPWGGANYMEYGTPDMFSLDCSLLQISAPLTPIGYQMPRTGRNYAGLGMGYNGVSGEREYMRIELSDTLISGKTYCAELYWSLSERSSEFGFIPQLAYRFYCNKLGMLFTKDSTSLGIGKDSNFITPQVFESNLMSDSVNWIKMTGSFVAQGGEKFLTIGWFFPFSQITTVRNDSNANCTGYYFIDDVAVYDCTPVGENEIILPQLISPNGDGKNDVYFINDSLPIGSKLTIFNRWGNEVYYSNNYQNNWDGTWQGHLLPSATYYAVLVMPKGTRKTTYIELVY